MYILRNQKKYRKKKKTKKRPNGKKKKKKENSSSSSSSSTHHDHVPVDYSVCSLFKCIVVVCGIITTLINIVCSSYSVRPILFSVFYGNPVTMACVCANLVNNTKQLEGNYFSFFFHNIFSSAQWIVLWKAQYTIQQWIARTIN